MMDRVTKSYSSQPINVKGPMSTTADVDPQYETAFFLSEYNNISGPIASQHQWLHPDLFYKLVWVKEGAGSHLISGIELPLIAGKIIIIAPGTPYKWGEGTRIKGVLCELSHSMLDAYFQKKLHKMAITHESNMNDTLRYTSQNNEALLSHLVTLLLIEIHKKSTLAIIRPLFMTFLHLLEPKNNTPHSLINKIDPLKNLEDLIEQFYFKENGVHFYAKQLGMGIKQLNALVRETHGKTVSNLIHERIILDAKFNLQSSLDSVKTIAYGLGFEDPSYFSRFFRRYTGLSPNQYRESKSSP